MDVWPIQPQTGGNPNPDDIVGRNQVIDYMLGQLKAGNNLLIVDPRRTGKTSTLTRLCRNPGDDTEAVMLSYEGAQTSDEVFDLTVKALVRHASLGARVAKALRHIVEVDAAAGPVKIKSAFAGRSRIDLLVDVIDAVESKLKSSQHLIIVLDEVPLAVANVAKSESPDAAAVLLQRLRALRQKQNRLRWVLAGSIGFHHVLRQANTTEGVINDLQPVSLGPLDADSGAFLAKCLLAGIGREAAAGAISRIVEDTGSIPFLIHHVVHLLGETGDGEMTDVSLDAAAEAWELFLDRDQSRSMTHLVTRLEDWPKEMRPLARSILDALATAEEPMTLDEIAELDAFVRLDRDRLLGVIELLIDDHYLADTNPTLSWRYDVLRRIWIRRRRLS